MLKDLIDKHKETIPVSDRINVVDMLTNESGQQELVTLFNDMGVVCKELEKFEQVGEQLKNESGMVTYLISQGYDNVTTESASEVAKEVWEKIKKAIAFLVDKFMLYFNKAKSLFMDILNNHEGKIKALLEIIKRTSNNVPNKDLMDSESFGKRIPNFEVFHDLGTFLDYNKLLETSAFSVNTMDQPITDMAQRAMQKVFKHLNIKSDERFDAFLGFTGNKVINLYSKDYRYYIKEEEVKTTYNPKNKITMKPNNIITVLENLLAVLARIKVAVNSISSKIVKYKNPDIKESGMFSTENIEHNVNMTMTASKLLLENNNKIIKDLLFILTQHIKCYDNNGKTVSILNSNDDMYQSDMKIIKEAIREKDWKTLEEMAKDKSLKNFPDLVKMVEEALENKPK